MNAISLFSGIGGIDIGFSAAGFNIIAQVEIDAFCRRVLRRHAPEWWPNAAQFADVFDFGRKDVTGEIAVIFGGFPCQPHSVAGKRKGAEDNRNLWPEFARIIGDIRPRAVLLENVPGIISNGYAGVVIGELAALGYDAQWGIVSAADAQAPHNRERWFCVAYAAERSASQVGNANGTGLPERRKGFVVNPETDRETTDYATTNQPERPGSIIQRGRRRAAHPRMGRDSHGIPAWLDNPRWPAGQGAYQYPWEPPRSVARSEKYREARVKALGNAVVPQVAYAFAVAMMGELSGERKSTFLLPL